MINMMPDIEVNEDLKPKFVITENKLKDFSKYKLYKLRQKLRNSMDEHREMRRLHDLNKNRFLMENDEDLDETKPLTTDEFTELVKDFVSKKNDSRLTLVKMRNALRGSEYITAFLNVQGSLQALVRGLSGQDERLQLGCAECIVNLSISTKQQSMKILKVCHSYLYAHLLGMNNYIKEDCLYAIGNFCRCGREHIAFVLSQDFFPQIINVLIDGDESLHKSAIYAMTSFFFYGFDMVSSEHFIRALKAIVPIYRKRCYTVHFLMSLLSASKECHDKFYFYQIHLESLKNLRIALNDEDKNAVYYLRIVSNCVAARSWRMMDDIMTIYPQILAECMLLASESDYPHLVKENLVLISNVLNHPGMYDILNDRDRYEYFHRIFSMQKVLKAADLLSVSD